MAEKFNNKYRIPSTRLPYWDYAQNGAYFVTICTRNSIHFLGKVMNGKMVLSKIGRIVEKYWYEIPNHFPFVKLNAFIVMPNHMHGIVIIDKPHDNINTVTVPVETPKLGVSTGNYKISEKWKPGTLGVIINQYKRICTINARRINPDFGWQSRYYDHIIRNEKSYNRIVKYIHSNPMRW